jgi:hypothetical protein
VGPPSRNNGTFVRAAGNLIADAEANAAAPITEFLMKSRRDMGFFLFIIFDFSFTVTTIHEQ